MGLKFKVDRAKFVNRILVPSSKMNPMVELTLDTDGTMYSITRMESGTHSCQLVLYAEFDVDVVERDPENVGPVRMNLGDVRKLVSALSQIQDDEVVLEYDGTAILYKSPALSFRFSVLIDDVMEKKTVSKKAISKWKTLTEFTLESEILKKFLAISGCMSNCDKVYLSTGKNGVKCLHMDRDSGSSDMIDMIVAETFTGEPLDANDGVIFSEEVFRFVVANRFDSCQVCITDIGTITFTISDGGYRLKYIATKRVK